MRNKILPFLAMFVGSICFGLLFVVIFVNGTELDCLRQSDQSYTCHSRTLFLGQIKTFDDKFDKVVDIVIAEDSCDDGCAYRAEFVRSSGGRQPLSIVYTDYDPVSEQVSAIKAQMDQGSELITYKADPSWWVLFLIGGLTLMSMALSPLIFLRR
ncbi:MAG TPA: hypothetical protein VHM28_00625 [Anaerolineales bacterium]|nr:hypothetical protein [Anaerolineales bacterium]